MMTLIKRINDQLYPLENILFVGFQLKPGKYVTMQCYLRFQIIISTKNLTR